MIGNTFKLDWTRLADLPDAEGYAGSYAGWSHGCLLVAGGANFPEKAMWDGGRKDWTDRVFAWFPEQDAWREIGKMPFGYAYGASVSFGGALYCIGGCDAAAHRADVLKLEWVDGELKAEAAPSLPAPLANHCAALLGSKVIVTGGSQKPGEQDASKETWMLDLASPGAGWERLPDLPGEGRFLAFAGFRAEGAGEFYVFGGIGLTDKPDGSGKARKMLSDAWKLDLATREWTRLADLPGVQAAGPTPVAADASGAIWLLGGDNGSRAGFQPVQEHPGFAPVVRRYDIASDSWSESGEAEDCQAPRAVLPFVPVSSCGCGCGCASGALGILVNGELRPGKRSNQVYRVSVGQ